MQWLYFRLVSLLPELPGQEEGQGLAEYALILVLIAVICFIALQVLGSSLSDAISRVSRDLSLIKSNPSRLGPLYAASRGAVEGGRRQSVHGWRLLLLGRSSQNIAC